MSRKPTGKEGSDENRRNRKRKRKRGGNFQPFLFSSSEYFPG
jgi:hypothetical protein